MRHTPCVEALIRLGRAQSAAARAHACSGTALAGPQHQAAATSHHSTTTPKCFVDLQAGLHARFVPMQPWSLCPGSMYIVHTPHAAHTRLTPHAAHRCPILVQTLNQAAQAADTRHPRGTLRDAARAAVQIMPGPSTEARPERQVHKSGPANVPRPGSAPAPTLLREGRAALTGLGASVLLLYIRSAQVSLSRCDSPRRRSRPVAKGAPGCTAGARRLTATAALRGCQASAGRPAAERRARASDTPAGPQRS